MSNFMKNARAWLGLGNDPYYDDDAEYDEDDDRYDRYDRGDRDDRSPRDRYDELDEAVEPEEDRMVRPTPQRSGTVTPLSSARDWDDDGGVRVISGPAPAEDTRGVVRPLPSANRPEVVSPVNFNDVQQVADLFKRSQPVILNLQGVDRDLSRRIIDFASGLCYGLEGEMERAADQVFLLTPTGATVSDDDRRRIREGDLLTEA